MHDLFGWDKQIGGQEKGGTEEWLSLLPNGA